MPQNNLKMSIAVSSDIQNTETRVQHSHSESTLPFIQGKGPSSHADDYNLVEEQEATQKLVQGTGGKGLMPWVHDSMILKRRVNHKTYSNSQLKTGFIAIDLLSF